METEYMFPTVFATGIIVGVIGYFFIQALCFAASQNDYKPQEKEINGDGK